MDGPEMIEVENLSKRYGQKLAVDGLSFAVQPGIVTGFLGPNGSGKSTMMRMIAGLDEPTAGRVVVNGARYRSARAPMAELGVLLEAKAVHTGRSAHNHLLALAQTNGISRRRVDQVIDIVGLRNAAGTRAGGFSLGMGQPRGLRRRGVPHHAGQRFHRVHDRPRPAQPQTPQRRSNRTSADGRQAFALRCRCSLG
jgi:ABC-2 type transport system ATP-binding protein